MKRKLFVMLLCVAMLLACGHVFAAPVIDGKTPADIIFVIDTTGSMSPYIRSVRENLTAFAEYLGENNINAHYAVVEYKDVAYTSYSNELNSVKEHSLGGTRWTSDVEILKNDLANTNVSGGYDWPETPQAALDWVLNLNDTSDWRQQNARLVFILTDAPSKKYSDYSGYHVAHDTVEKDTALINALKSKSIITSVIGSILDREHYKPLFTGTEGVFIDIEAVDWYKSMVDIASYITDMATTEPDDRLDHTTLETVPETTANTVENKLKDDEVVSTDSVINTMTDNYRPYYDPSLPHEVSAGDFEAVDKFITKIDTVNLYSPTQASGDWGYFLFKFELPYDDLRNDCADLTIANSDPLKSAENIYDPNGFINFVMLDMSGNKITTISKEVLVLIYGQVNDTLVLYLVKPKGEDTIKLWSTSHVAGSENEDYLTKNKEDTEMKLDDSVGELIKNDGSLMGTLRKKINDYNSDEYSGSYDVKGLLSKLFDMASDFWAKYGESITSGAKELLNKASSGGGCNSGLGLVGVLALVGFAFRKR